MTPTAGTVSVRSYGATGNGTADDTAAFLRAEDAALASVVRFGSGPTGAPQAVVYVPHGTYRLLHLVFRSNVRMEVDAGAVLEQAGGRLVNVANSPASLIDWDAPAGPALTNVSLVGVGTSRGGLKSLANPVFSGWDLSGDFTLDLDPAATNANEKEVGVQALNVSGFLIQNVYSIQNDSQPVTFPTTSAGWWPETQKAALGLRENPATPISGTVFYDPHNGIVSNWYNIHAPKGYGPNQVEAGHNLQFEHIFSQGGTALRLETDASQKKSFGSELRGLTADDIAGLDCNRAVSFSPHSQLNYNVAVTHVQAIGCADGVVESIDETNITAAGAFFNTTLAGVTVIGGPGAQNGNALGTGMWTVGTSVQAFAKDQSRKAPWAVVYAAGTFSCRGSFQLTSNVISTSSGFVRPTCGS